MNATPIYKSLGRNLMCAVSACLLSVVLLSAISQIPVQAAHHAPMLQD